MGRTRSDIVTALFFGAFGLVLTYLAARFFAVPGDFWIALAVGGGIALVSFLLLFLRGIRAAKALDRWEAEQTEAYTARFSVRMLSAKDVWQGNLYLYPDRLTVRAPRKDRELRLDRADVKEIMVGAEDTELFTDRGVYSLDCGEGSEEAEKIRSWFDNRSVL